MTIYVLEFLIPLVVDPPSNVDTVYHVLGRFYL